MQELGRLEDLPLDYRQALTERNLVPLWPSLRAVLPPHTPRPRTQPICWPYQDLRPLLLQAGELTPMEKAERRVLVLANPGHGLTNMQASATMYLGMQLLLPGEWAPSHRHTPNAVRMVVEGTGAYTTVEGEKCPMHRGDLILTPSGLWHEHGHDGTEPVVWLDVLDLPLMYYMEASYVTEGKPQPVTAQGADAAYQFGGVVPSPVFSRSKSAFPMLRYPWADVRAALQALALSQPGIEAVQVAYINPETGAPCQKVLGYSALMLRPGETLALPARSCAAVYHLIEGGAGGAGGQGAEGVGGAVGGRQGGESAEGAVGGQGGVTVAMAGHRFHLAEADTCCLPGYQATTLTNASATQPAYLFMADDAPLQQALGVYEVRR